MVLTYDDARDDADNGERGQSGESLERGENGEHGPDALDAPPTTAEMAAYEQAAHGLSVVEIKKEASGWALVKSARTRSQRPGARAAGCLPPSRSSSPTRC